MPSQDINLEFKGLRNTLCRARVPVDYAYRMWNADTERGSLQARLGIGENFKWTSWAATDHCYGAGYGKYATNEQFILFVKQSASSFSRLIVRDAGGSTGAATVSTDNVWDERDPSTWQCTQFDNYIFAINKNDGLYRWKLGGSAPGDFVKVPTRFFYGADSEVSSFVPPYPLRDYVTTAGATFDVIGWRVGSSPTLTTSATSTITTSSDGLLVECNSAASLNNRLFHAIISRPASSTALSFDRTRFLGVTMDVARSFSITTGVDSSSWLSGGTFVPSCFVSTVATASTTNLTSADWVKVPDDGVLQERVALDARFPQVHLYINLDRLRTYGTTIWPEANFANIRRIAFGAWVGQSQQTGVNLIFSISRLTLGGNPLNRPNVLPSSFYGDQATLNANANLKDVEYAWQYYDSGTLASGDASQLKFPRAEVFGEPYRDTELPPMGSQSIINAVSTIAAGTFDQIRFWRKRYSDNEKWYLLETVANPGIGSTATSSADYRIDSAEYGWGTTTTAASLPVTQSQDAILNGQAIAAWKTHLVVGIDNELYLSYANDPSRYLPPVRNLGLAALPTDDPTIGRTVYMANDQADVVLQLVADDSLYIVGQRGVYVMVGDSAADSSPPRLLASRGALGVKSACGFAGGVLVGSSDGLWYYRVSRASIDSNQTSYDEVELTKDVRFSYAELLKDGAPNGLVVRTDQGQIFLYRGYRYMKRDRDGEWSEGMLNIDAIQDGQTGSGSPDVPVVGGSWNNDIPTGVPGSNWILGTTGTPPLGHIGTGTSEGSASDAPYTGGSGGGVIADPSPSGAQLRSVPNPEGIIEAISVPFKGLKLFGETGIIFNNEYTEDLRPYRSDAGRAINWFWSGGTLGESRSKVAKVKMFATNLLRGQETVTAQPDLRFILTTFDGKAGESIRIVERDAEKDNASPPVKNDVQLLPWKANIGYRHIVTVASLDSAQLVDGCTITLEPMSGGEGN